MANLQLAKNLKTLREKHNLTQVDVSRMLNISRQAYSNYERAVREPDLTTLIYFSEFYKITLDELILGNPGSSQIRETFLPYAEVKDPVTNHSVFVSQEELELIMGYRKRSVDDQSIIKRFLDLDP